MQQQVKTFKPHDLVDNSLFGRARRAQLIASTIIGPILCLGDFFQNWYYLISKPFVNDQLKSLFTFFILFPFVILTIIWTLRLAFVEMKKEFYLSLVDYIFLPIYGSRSRADMISRFKVVLERLKSKFLTGLVFGFASETHILPLFMDFEIGSISQSEFDHFYRKVLDAYSIHSTDRSHIFTFPKQPINRAEMMVDRHGINSYIQSDLFKILTVTTDQIQLLFKTMPLFLLKFINIAQTDEWDSNESKIILCISIATLIINSSKFINQIFEKSLDPILWLYFLNEERIQAHRNPICENDSIKFIDLKPISNDQVPSLIRIAQAKTQFFQTMDEINIQLEDEFQQQWTRDPLSALKAIENILFKGQQSIKCVQLQFSNLNPFKQNLKMKAQDVIWPCFLEKFCADLPEILGSVQIKLMGPNLQSLDLNIKGAPILNYIESLQCAVYLVTFNLFLSDSNIRYTQALTVLQYMVRLNDLTLDLSNNQIVEIQSLDCLKNLAQLKSLKINLSQNELENIMPLSSISFLTQLETLSLNLITNQITKLDMFQSFICLSSLRNLSLYLSGNHIEGFEPLFCLQQLNSLQIVELDLNQILITDVTKLSSLRCLVVIEMDKLKFNIFNLDHIANVFDIKNPQNLVSLNITLSECLLRQCPSLADFAKFDKLKILEMKLNKNTLQNLDELSMIQQYNELRLIDINLDQNKLRNSSQLRFIEYLNKVEILKLSVSSNQLQEVSVLNSLRNAQSLKHLMLDLSDNSIANLTGVNQIGSLTTLECLQLSFTENSIDNLTPLSALKGLTQLIILELDFSINQIKDVSPLSEINSLTNLEKLKINLFRNKIEDISSIMYSNLKKLSRYELVASKNQITSLNSIQQLGQLSNMQGLVLQLDENKITDITIVQELKQLTKLVELEINFKSNKIKIIKSLQFIELLTKLTKLQLSLEDNLVQSISQLNVISKLVQLKFLRLDLRKTQINVLADFSRLNQSTMIEKLELYFSQNKLVDISHLGELRRLTSLRELTIDLQKNQIVDISPLGKLGEIISLQILKLYFWENQINDIKCLEDLKTLKNLLQLDIDLRFKLILSSYNNFDVNHIVSLEQLLANSLLRDCIIKIHSN